MNGLTRKKKLGISRLKDFFKELHHMDKDFFKKISGITDTRNKDYITYPLEVMLLTRNT